MLFWDTVKLLGNSFILSRLALKKKRIRAIFSLRLIRPHYWDRTLLSTLLNAPWIIRFSTLAGGNRDYCLSCVSTRECSLQSFWVFPCPRAVPSPACANQYSAIDPKGTLCRTLDFIFLWSSPLYSSVHWGTQLHLLYSGRLLGSTRIPLPSAVAWTFCPGSKLGTITGLASYVSTLSGITIMHCLWCNVWKLLIQIFGLFCFVVVVFTWFRSLVLVCIFCNSWINEC